jgi:NADPH-dependent 2,4-dienoyl-CoA reductase/sulfur reductase-like enzyme/rhodanese-related sulfurtransferase
MAKRIVIVGGVAAGATAAAKARRMSEDVEIVLLEAGPHVSFANCGLPYYVGGEIVDRDDLFVADEVLLRKRFGIDVRTNANVTAVDRAGRAVAVRYADGGTAPLGYDRLILATGAEAIRPPIVGMDRPDVFFLRTVPDADAIVAFMAVLGEPASGRPHQALIIGGGYIGVEAAEQFGHRQMDVTIVEMLPQLLPTLDAEMAAIVTSAMRAEGRQVVLGDAVASMADRHGAGVAITRAGREIPFSLCVVATGVRPNVKLAAEAGIELGPTGAIRVDRLQRTSDPWVYAAGDNSETVHHVLKREVSVPLAAPANKAGRVAGTNAALDLAGAADDDPLRLRMPDVLGTSIVRAGSVAAAATGLTETRARAEGLAVAVTHLPGLSHAGYYPGAERLFLKLVWHAGSGRLLGAQAVGEKGADKRIDVIATAIAGDMTVEDLEGLDLCYSPQYGAAKDAVILAGHVAANAHRGVSPAVTAEELLRAMAEGGDLVVLDVRTAREWQAGHLDGAAHIPVDDLRQRLAEVPADRPVAIHCGSGYRSYIAQRILMNCGRRNVRNVLGGMLMISQSRSVGEGGSGGA